jgi:hypothetical protein
LIPSIGVWSSTAQHLSSSIFQQGPLFSESHTGERALHLASLVVHGTDVRILPGPFPMAWALAVDVAEMATISDMQKTSL